MSPIFCLSFFLFSEFHFEDKEKSFFTESRTIGRKREKDENLIFFLRDSSSCEKFSQVIMVRCHANEVEAI